MIIDLVTTLLPVRQPGAQEPPPWHGPTGYATDARLDTFAGIYNKQRPHRSLPGRATPAAAHAARPKADPGDRSADTYNRVRTDRIDATGLVTLRHNGKLHHIGIGRAPRRNPRPAPRPRPAAG